MKKFQFLIIPLILSITMLCGFMPNNEFIIDNAKIIKWNRSNQFVILDTCVDINFDKIKIDDVKSIKFEIHDQGQLLTKAISDGENLVNLLKYSAQFWGQEKDNYKSVTGIRTLSCKMRLRDEFQDNGIWKRDAFMTDTNKLPQTLIVTISTLNGDYITNN